MVLLVEVSLPCSFEGIGGLKVTDVSRKTTPLLWSTVGEKALAKGFSFNMGDAMENVQCLTLCLRVCSHTN